MPSITTLADLFSTETREQVLDDILGVGAAISLKVTSWQPGGSIRTTLVLVAQKVADLTLLTQLAVKGGLLDYATKGWLTLLASSNFRVFRIPAQYASGDSFRIANDSDESYDRVAGSITVAHNVTGKTYHNVNDVSVAAGATLEDIEFEADEVGTGSDGGPDTIQQLVTSAPGITVSNDESVLGSDEEEDEDLRARCRAKLGSLSPNGPKEAYEYVLKTPELTPTSIPITRVQVVLDIDTGTVNVYCATAAGAPTDDDIDIADASLDRWATPWCIDAPAHKGIEDATDITYAIWIEGSNLTNAQVEDAISTAIARLLSRFAIGGKVVPPEVNGYLYIDEIKGEIQKAIAGITRLTVTSPSQVTVDGFAAIPITVGHFLTLGTITPTVNVVP